jgi:class 3 adenylate cyclase
MVSLVNRHKTSSWFLVWSLAIIGSCLACIGWVLTRADRELRDELLLQTQAVARAVNRELFQQLTGTAADLQSPAYRQLKEQFYAFRVAQPHSRFLYLLGHTPPGGLPPEPKRTSHSTTNNTIFFYIDSEAPASKDYSPPGMIYSEADAACRQVFITKQGTITKYTDRWGTWVSAYVPLLDPHTGKLLAVLGMDIDASAWKWNVGIKAGRFLAALTLAMLLGVVLAIFIIGRNARLSKRPFLLPSFATKILLSLCLIAVLSSLLSSWAISEVAQQYQMRRMREWLKAIAETSATFINGDQFVHLTRPAQHGGAEWQGIATTLRRFQQTYPAIRYIYTMARLPDTDQTGQVQFIVDPMPEADANGNGVIDPNETAARLGEPYNARALAPRLLDGFTIPTCEDALTKDQWGCVLSGYAPIHDSHGMVVGLVGIDLAAEHLDTIRHVFLWQCLVVVMAVILTSLIVAVLLSRHLARPLTALQEGIRKVAGGDLEAHLDLKTGDEFEKLSDAFNAMTTDLKERAFMRDSLTRYINQAGRQGAAARGAPVVAARRRITLLVCELPGLAAQADTLPPEVLAQQLNACFARLIACVVKHGGSVCQLQGDGLLAIFGAPLETGNHEQQAVLAAIEMRQAVGAQRPLTDGAPMALGIGIHTGLAIVGNLGSPQRSEYTALGAMVHFTTELGRQAYTLRHTILLSHSTAQALDSTMPLQPLETIRLPGQLGEIALFTVAERSKTAPKTLFF